MPMVGGRRKKKRTEKQVDVSEQELKNTPRCLVIKRGPVGEHLRDLVNNMREVMMPNTSKALKESRLNRLEDFTAVAGGLNISHLIVFTSTKAASYMKLIKLPQGPTLTFRLDSYTLSQDVRGAQKRPRIGPRDFTVAPLQVLNNFGGASGEGEKTTPKQLVAEMLRGLFPAVDVRSFNMYDARRSALFHYEPETDSVHFRHYTVARQSVSLERGVQKLLRSNRLPKMGGKADIADYVLGGGGAASESEIEPTAEAPLAGGGKIGVRLTEVGPRMTLQLIKIEDGVNTGAVLYHRFETKTLTEQEVLQAKAKQKQKLKERNDKLSARMGERKAKSAKEKKKIQQAADKQQEAEEKASGDEFAPKEKKTGGGDGGQGGAGEAGQGVKRKRFNPLYSKKAKKPAAREGTVEFGNSSGGGKSAGKGGKGGKSSGKGGGAARAMDRFRKAQKGGKGK